MKAKRIEKLKNSMPIEITGNEITPSDDLKEYRKNALRYGLDNLRRSYINKDTGDEIAVSRGSIEEVLHHNINENGHIQSVAAIPQIIENSIFIDSIENEDKNRNPDVESYDYYVVGLKIGADDYTVKAVIANGANGKRHYDHRLTQIEMTKLLSTLLNVNKSGEESSFLSGQNSGISSPPSITDYKDKRLISILQVNYQKLTNNQA
ncbi:hypothetical protein AGMMS49982_21640 [Bacteroidia bacterium]|nr:hypothetical protein AGMMS49982_21640 [Bacteroidia bacterium]